MRGESFHFESIPILFLFFRLLQTIDSLFLCTKNAQHERAVNYRQLNMLRCVCVEVKTVFTRQILFVYTRFHYTMFKELFHVKQNILFTQLTRDKVSIHFSL